jgi:hypothetical protein
MKTIAFSMPKLQKEVLSKEDLTELKSNVERREINK